MNTSIFRPLLVLFALLSALTGIVYPFAVTGAARAAFPAQVEGSLVMRDGLNTVNVVTKNGGSRAFALRWLAPQLAHPDLSIRRQCELLGVNRAGLYYQPLGESEENLRLMRLLDEQYTRTPFYGRRRMRAWLRDQGYEVNPKRVAMLHLNTQPQKIRGIILY